jgi:hypothetical protein
MHLRVYIVPAILATIALAAADLNDTLAPARNHPAIGYDTELSHDVVTELNRKLHEGKVLLKFDETRAGYLRSVLRALDVPVESQVVVFSKTSVQSERIEPRNPRTIFFNDSVSVAWMGGGFIELAAQDPEQGVRFFALKQQPMDKPVFDRERDGYCLRCHVSEASLGVPGMLVRSMYTAPNGVAMLLFGGFFTDHRSPLKERWGGWYVTGDSGSARHLGNAVVSDMDQPEWFASRPAIRLDSLKDKFDVEVYLSPYSDIAALMVFDHQMHMSNLLTRIGWEVRAAMAQPRALATLVSNAPGDRRDLGVILPAAAKEAVDYMLFVDEAPLRGKMRGTSGFTETFAALGPRDSRDRSLRQLDLEHRLMRYPCSYMIYSKAFDALPAQAKDAIYHRMWQILSGEVKSAKYARLSLADRQAVAEILRETKNDLPRYFGPITH